VIRTDAVERVGIEIVRDTQMPELGVEQAVQDVSVDDRAAADAAPDRDVPERPQLTSRAPAVLAQSRRVHVCVERNWNVEPATDLLPDVCVRPARLRRGP
jgi:hypothetical protein